MPYFGRKMKLAKEPEDIMIMFSIINSHVEPTFTLSLFYGRNCMKPMLLVRQALAT